MFKLTLVLTDYQDSQSPNDYMYKTSHNLECLSFADYAKSLHMCENNLLLAKYYPEKTGLTWASFGNAQEHS